MISRDGVASRLTNPEFIKAIHQLQKVFSFDTQLLVTLLSRDSAAKRLGDDPPGFIKALRDLRAKLPASTTTAQFGMLVSSGNSFVSRITNPCFIDAVCTRIIPLFGLAKCLSLMNHNSITSRLVKTPDYLTHIEDIAKHLKSHGVSDNETRKLLVHFAKDLRPLRQALLTLHDTEQVCDFVQQCRNADFRRLVLNEHRQQ